MAKWFYQPWTDLKSSTPTEWDNSSWEDSSLWKYYLLHLGCEVYHNKEEEKVWKHPLVLCNWLLNSKQEYKKAEHKHPQTAFIHGFLEAP